MKRIIDGKKYDTETATLVAEWHNEVAKSDFTWYEESLYRKRTGEYFVHGYGHAASPWAEHMYGAWQPSEGIRPLTKSQALEWAERHMDPDDYEAEFGEVPE